MSPPSGIVTGLLAIWWIACTFNAGYNECAGLEGGVYENVGSGNGALHKRGVGVEEYAGDADIVLGGLAKVDHVLLVVETEARYLQTSPSKRRHIFEVVQESRVDETLAPAPSSP